MEESQLYSFGDPDRDPRGRVITVAYYALVKLADHRVRAATDASSAAWFAVSEVRRLAFDHNRILEMALLRLKGKVRDQPIGFELRASTNSTAGSTSSSSAADSTSSYEIRIDVLPLIRPSGTFSPQAGRRL